MSDPPRSERRPSPPAAAASAPRNTGAGPSSHPISSGQTHSGRASPVSWEQQLEIVITEARKLNQLLGPQQQQQQQQQPRGQEGSSSSGRGGGGGAGSSTTRQNRGSADRTRIDNMIDEFDAVYYALLSSNVPLPTAATTTPRAPTQRSQTPYVMSGNYISQIETILREYPDRRRRRQIFQLQLEILLQLQVDSGGNASHNEVIRQLRQVIVEQDEEAKTGEGERRRVRRNGARRHGNTPSPAPSDTAAASRGPRSALSASRGDIGIGGQSLQVASAPASSGPSRSGTPQDRGGSSSGLGHPYL